MVRFLYLVLFLFYSSLHLSAQTGSGQDSTLVTPQGLTLNQISDFGRTTRDLIEDTESLIGQVEDLNQIETRLNGMGPIIDGKLSYLMDTGVFIRLDQLDKEDRELDLLNNRLSSWEGSVNEVNQKAVKGLQNIDSTTMIWNLTLDSLNTLKTSSNFERIADSTSNDIASTIQSFLVELDSTNNDLSQYLKRVEDLQTQITIAENKLANGIDAVKSRRDEAVKSLWTPTYSYIWDIQRDTTQQVSRSLDIGKAVQTELDLINVFVRNNPDLKIYVFLYLVVLLSVVFYLRSKANELYSGYTDELKEAKVVLQNPILSSLIIGWFISMIFAFLPRELMDLFSLVVLGPLIFILVKLYPDWKWKKVVVFSITFLLFLVITRLNYALLSSRLFLLLIDILAVLYFIHHQGQKELIDQANKYWFGTLPFFIRSFIILAIISTVANIIGSLQLAQIFTSAILGGVIATITLKAAVSLTRSFVFLILLGPMIKYSHILQDDKDLVLEKLSNFFRILGFSVWLIIILNLLNLRKDLFSAFVSVINTPLSVGELNISLGNVLAFVISLQVTIWLSNFIRYFLEKEVFTRVKMKPGVPNTIVLLIRFTFALLGILIAFAAAGVQIDKIAIAMGALGVGIGFGLQNIVNNFVSGIIIALERPIKIGDNVDLPDASGIVRDIGLRASTVRTWEGSDVIIPNGELLAKQLTNWTYYDKRKRVMTELSVPLGTDMEKFTKFLIDTAKKIPGIMKNPGPYLNFTGTSNGAMQVNLYCWIPDVGTVFGSGTTIRKHVFKAMLDAGYDVQVPVQEISVGNKESGKKSEVPSKEAAGKKKESGEKRGTTKGDTAAKK